MTAALPPSVHSPADTAGPCEASGPALGSLDCYWRCAEANDNSHVQEFVYIFILDSSRLGISHPVGTYPVPCLPEKPQPPRTCASS